MEPIERNTWGVIAGLAVCCAVFMFVGLSMAEQVCLLPRERYPSLGKTIGRNVAPKPAAIQMSAAKFVRSFAPLLLAPFSGGLVAGLIIGGGKLWPGIAISALPLLLTLLRAMLDPPLHWFDGAAFMLALLAALAGAKLAGVLRKPPFRTGSEQHDMRRENMAC